MILQEAEGLRHSLKQKFRDCSFEVVVEDTSFFPDPVLPEGYLFIILQEGPVDAFVEGRPKGSEYYYVEMGRLAGYPKTYGYRSDQISTRSVRLLYSGFILTSGVISIFKRLGDLIAFDFGGDDYNSIDFYFAISDRYDNNKVGSIAKPTKIDYKIAKRPRRRSVAENILRGF